MATLARRIVKYALAAPGANTAFPTAITPNHHGSHFRVWVALTTASVFNMRVTDGTTAYVNGLNGSVALAAGDVYQFDVPCPKTTDGASGGTALSYNFEIETDSVVRMLVVDEVTSA